MPLIPAFSFSQGVQLVGAAAVLLAYAGHRRLAPRVREGLNAGGAGCLVWSAGTGGQMGFFLLNAIWLGIALQRLWTLRDTPASSPLPAARIH